MIISVPNPILRQPSKPFRLDQPKHRRFLAELGDTLLYKENPPGVGLSAVQVGNPLAVFLTYLPKDYADDEAPKHQTNPILTAFINPKITAHARTTTLGPNPKKPILEGCLSIPNLYGPVPRYPWVEVSYTNLDGKSLNHRFSGFFARVIQHEYDHLKGVLFTDHTLKHQLPLFIDTGDTFEPVPNPQALIKW